MTDKDFKFIQAVLLKKEEIVDLNLDWYSILGFLELNKISGYFFNRVRESNLEIPKEVFSKLSKIYYAQSLRNKKMREWIQKISAELLKNYVEHCFLKGSVLNNIGFDRDTWENFYQEGERISNDIDLLTSPKEITKITKILKDMGFVQGYYDAKNFKVVELSRLEIIQRRMNRGETAPFIIILEDEIVPFIEIDINFSVDHLPIGRENIVNQMLEARDFYYITKDFKLSTLEKYDFFIHLILHQYKEMEIYSMVLRNKDLDFYKLLDLSIFIDKYGILDDFLRERIRKYEIEKEVYYTLKIIYELFDKNLLIKKFIQKMKVKSSFLVIDPETQQSYQWNKPTLFRIKKYFKGDCLENAKK